MNETEIKPFMPMARIDPSAKIETTYGAIQRLHKQIKERDMKIASLILERDARDWSRRVTRNPQAMMIQWPELILNPDAEFKPGVAPEHRRAAAIAEGLSAWGCCHAGSDLAGKLPEGFGRGIQRLAKIAGINSATPESFHKAADEFLSVR